MPCVLGDEIERQIRRDEGGIDIDGRGEREEDKDR